jgi:iron(III) transport system substrate-binding protein
MTARKSWKALFTFCLALLGAASGHSQSPEPLSRNLVVYCPHPKDFIDAIVQEFEVETGIKVEVLSAGTGELLKRIESERAAPLCDVMWGGSRASLETYRRFFEPYISANSAAFIGAYVDENHDYTPFTAVPTVIMYNRNLVPGGTCPASWSDLLGREWRGRIAFADPAVSSSSFEALVTMLFAMGKGDPSRGWPYVGSFLENLDGRLLAGSSEVYNGVANGEYAIGVTFEEAAAIYVQQGAPVGIVYPSEGTIVEPDGVAVIRGARNRSNARCFIDFVTSRKVQVKIARDLNRRSCRSDVDSPRGLLSMSSINAIPGDYKWACENKEKIFGQFRNLALKL